MINIVSSSSYDKISNISSLEVQRVTHTNVKGNWILHERFLHTDEMIYLAKGELNLTINKAEHTIKNNSFIFMHRYSIVSGRQNSDIPCEFYTVLYNSVPDVISYCHVISVNGSSIYIDEILKRMYSAQQNGHQNSNMTNILFLALLHEIDGYINKKLENTPLMTRSIELIDQNINTMLNLEELSRLLGYNSDYLSRQFRKCYGMTIKNYIDWKKLNIAKHLLTSSDMSIDQVAGSVGFDNYQNFHKFFKYHEKTAPGQYRRIFKK